MHHAEVSWRISSTPSNESGQNNELLKPTAAANVQTGRTAAQIVPGVQPFQLFPGPVLRVHALVSLRA